MHSNDSGIHKMARVYIFQWGREPKGIRGQRRSSQIRLIAWKGQVISGRNANVAGRLHFDNISCFSARVTLSEIIVLSRKVSGQRKRPAKTLRSLSVAKRTSLISHHCACRTLASGKDRAASEPGQAAFHPDSNRAEAEDSRNHKTRRHRSVTAIASSLHS